MFKVVLAILLELGACFGAIGATPPVVQAVAELALPPLLGRAILLAAVFAAIGVALWLFYHGMNWLQERPRLLCAVSVAVVYILCLSLSGCASVVPHEARHRLLGMATPDVLACMGPPAERDGTVPRLKVWTWSYVDPGASIAFGSMTALGMGISLQQHGSCRVVIAMSGGRVTSVHYSPASDGIAGPLGACKAIVSDCMDYPTRTPLPADFHPDAPEIPVKAADK